MFEYQIWFYISLSQIVVHFALASAAVAVGTAVQIVVLSTVERCAFVGGRLLELDAPECE